MAGSASTRSTLVAAEMLKVCITTASFFDKHHPGNFGKVGMRHFHKLRIKLHCPIVHIDKLWSMVPPAAGTPSEGDFQAERQATEEMKFWAWWRWSPEPFFLMMDLGL
uniref:Uncharacterized protein n=1 Tax=Vitis vinifera TaxID=29760 RepID=F6H964_VITVI